MIKIYKLLLIGLLPITCFSQQVYYKSIDKSAYEDSLTQAIDSLSDLRVSVYFHRYVRTKIDTQDQRPNLIWNSSSHLYRYENRYYYQFVNSFIATKPSIHYGPSLDFFLLNDSAIVQTEFRPIWSDYEMDSIDYKEWIEKGLKEEEARALATLIIPTKCSDCPSVRIVIAQGEKETVIRFQPLSQFDSKDAFYKYNSQLRLFPFYLLLWQDHQNFASRAESILEDNNLSVLSNEARIKWLLENIPKDIEYLQELQVKLEKELKGLEK